MSLSGCRSGVGFAEQHQHGQPQPTDSWLGTSAVHTQLQLVFSATCGRGLAGRQEAVRPRHPSLLCVQGRVGPGTPGQAGTVCCQGWGSRVHLHACGEVGEKFCCVRASHAAGARLPMRPWANHVPLLSSVEGVRMRSQARVPLSVLLAALLAPACSQGSLGLQVAQSKFLGLPGAHNGMLASPQRW